VNLISNILHPIIIIIIVLIPMVILLTHIIDQNRTLSIHPIQIKKPTTFLTHTDIDTICQNTIFINKQPDWTTIHHNCTTQAKTQPQTLLRSRIASLLDLIQFCGPIVIHVAGYITQNVSNILRVLNNDNNSPALLLLLLFPQLLSTLSKPNVKIKPLAHLLYGMNIPPDGRSKQDQIVSCLKHETSTLGYFSYLYTPPIILMQYLRRPA